MTALPPHTDLAHWARAARTEVDDLLRALEGRPTVDREKAIAARGHFNEGFVLVGQALDSHPQAP